MENLIFENYNGVNSKHTILWQATWCAAVFSVCGPSIHSDAGTHPRQPFQHDQKACTGFLV